MLTGKVSQDVLALADLKDLNLLDNDGLVCAQMHRGPKLWSGNPAPTVSSTMTEYWRQIRPTEPSW